MKQRAVEYVGCTWYALSCPGSWPSFGAGATVGAGQSILQACALCIISGGGWLGCCQSAISLAVSSERVAKNECGEHADDAPFSREWSTARSLSTDALSITSYRSFRPRPRFPWRLRLAAKSSTDAPEVSSSACFHPHHK